MPPRIPDNKRAAILDDIQARAGSVRTIADKHGVSTKFVQTVAQQAGITDAWSRERTKKAIEARAVDHQARLVRLSGRSAGVAETILASFEGMTAAEWTKVSAHTRGIVFGIVTDKAHDLGPRDDSGVEAAQSMIGALASTIDAVAEQIKSASDASGD